jgi:hypothetical protein
MMYNTWDYWVSGLYPSSRILKNTFFRKLDLFQSSCEGWEKTTMLGQIETANYNHWKTYVSITTAPHLRTETDPVSEMLCSLEYRAMDKVQKPNNSRRYGYLIRGTIPGFAWRI